MTTFTTEDREAVIQGATGARYQFMDTSPQAQEVNNIINGICHQLQALSTVINSLRTDIESLKMQNRLAQTAQPTRTEGQDDCGK